jgi:hypothetical protein
MCAINGHTHANVDETHTHIRCYNLSFINKKGNTKMLGAPRSHPGQRPAPSRTWAEPATNKSEFAPATPSWSLRENIREYIYIYTHTYVYIYMHIKECICVYVSVHTFTRSHETLFSQTHMPLHDALSCPSGDGYGYPHPTQRPHTSSHGQRSQTWPKATNLMTS